MIELRSIKQPNEGFENEKAQYLARLQSATLDPDLTHLRYSLPWPVDTTNPYAHLTCFFGELNYSRKNRLKPISPVQERHAKHTGVDIQLPLNTPIYSPVDGIITLTESGQEAVDNRVREWAEVFIYSEELKLQILLCHLNVYSVPQRIFEVFKFGNSRVKVTEGEFIGTVGVFFNDWMRYACQATELVPAVEIPSDVEAFYGRSYNHLHFKIHHSPKLIWYTNPSDPLPLLHKLY